MLFAVYCVIVARVAAELLEACAVSPESASLAASLQSAVRGTRPESETAASELPLRPASAAGSVGNTDGLAAQLGGSEASSSTAQGAEEGEQTAAAAAASTAEDDQVTTADGADQSRRVAEAASVRTVQVSGTVWRGNSGVWGPRDQRHGGQRPETRRSETRDTAACAVLWRPSLSTE